MSLNQVTKKRDSYTGFLLVFWKFWNSPQPVFTCSKSTMETTEQFAKSTTSSLLLILNKFYTLFWCFHCWLWTSKCWLGKICGLENYLSLSHFMYIMDVSFLNIWSFCNFTGPLEGLRLLRGKVRKRHL